MKPQDPYEQFTRRSVRGFVAPGACGPRSVRVMARTPSRGAHRLRLWSLDFDRDRHELAFEPTEDLAASDGTFSVRYGHGGEGRPLEPNTRYRFDVVHLDSDERIGQGELITAPAPGSRAAGHATVGVVSCHNPFTDDGELSTEAMRCLEVAPDTLRREGVQRVLFAGDQVYGDLPEALSLFDDDAFRALAPFYRDSIFECRPEEVRALFQRRYRAFFKPERFLELQAGFASHCILDDHEIVDNFGSAPAHGTARWAAIREGGLAAYHDYQARRVFGDARPRCFDHGFRHGDLAVYVLDLRSERVAREGKIQILGPVQLARLATFLERESDARAVALVLSVPILHVPDWIATAARKLTREGHDADDRWSSDAAQQSRDAMLSILSGHTEKHPEQRLILLGGDIHVGSAMRFSFAHEAPDGLQLVSSALTNLESAALRFAAEHAPEFTSRMGEHAGTPVVAHPLEGVAGYDHNPFGGLNFGVVDVERQGDTAGVRFRLFSADDAETPAARLVFDSGLV